MIADSINTLVGFCARRDVPALTRDLADVAILFGGSIVSGGDVLASAMRTGAARHYMIVGGRGHTTEALRAQFGGVEDEATEAALFDRYLRSRHGLAADLLEHESTNCGNNVTNALAMLRSVPYTRLLVMQDATMQQRMDAGFRLHAPAARIVNFATHRTLVDSTLAYIDPPPGMWPLDRYVSMLMGEIPRLAASGYGPAGRGFIAHVDIPSEVRDAYDHLRTETDFSQRS
jgi:hypothetical protein